MELPQECQQFPRLNGMYLYSRHWIHCYRFLSLSLFYNLLQHFKGWNYPTLPTMSTIQWYLFVTSDSFFLDHKSPNRGELHRIAHHCFYNLLSKARGIELPQICQQFTHVEPILLTISRTSKSWQFIWNSPLSLQSFPNIKGWSYPKDCQQFLRTNDIYLNDTSNNFFSKWQESKSGRVIQSSPLVLSRF